MGTLRSAEKPTNIEEYKRWLQLEHSTEITQATESYYAAIALRAKQDIEASAFWSDLLKELSTFRDEYLVTTNYPLFQTETPPAIYIKPFASVLDKSFRQNILLNKSWPKPPSKGWVLPTNWLALTNDILRTLITVKYMDGVQFLVCKLKSFCQQRSLSCEAAYEARTEGYYAAHCYIRHTVEVPTMSWATERIEVQLEIQITTQLQELIRAMTHTYYEKRRSQQLDRSVKWQWDYKSEEFIPNYLGHILHYLEGMIMEIRDKNRR